MNLGRPSKSKTKEVEALLGAFDLSKYARCDHWSLMQWFYALLYRQHVWLSLADSAPPGSSKALDYARLLSDDPLGRTAGDDYLDSQHLGAVRGLALADAWLAHRLVTQAMPEIAERLELSRKLIDEGRFSESASAFPREANRDFDASMWSRFGSFNSTDSRLGIQLEEGVAYLAVDLRAPHGVLMEEFDTVISQKKQEFSATLSPLPKIRYFNEKSAKKWIESRLLPCLDLMLVSRCRELFIPAERLTRALFSNQPDGGSVDAVRRTMDRATEFMETDLIWTLHLSAEQSSRMSDSR